MIKEYNNNVKKYQNLTVESVQGYYTMKVKTIRSIDSKYLELIYTIKCDELKEQMQTKPLPYKAQK